MRATTVHGDTFNAKVLAFDSDIDVCLIFMPDMEEDDTEVLTIARKAPVAGDKIYNIAAPYGIFEVGMAPILEGRFNGNSEYFAYYSLPGAPGSSGSMLINEKGRLVGVLHSVYVRFQNIIISCTYQELKEFMSYYLEKYQKWHEVMDELGLDNPFIIKD